MVKISMNVNNILLTAFTEISIKNSASTSNKFYIYCLVTFKLSL